LQSPLEIIDVTWSANNCSKQISTCHVDYKVVGGSVHVLVYSDQVNNEGVAKNRCHGNGDNEATKDEFREVIRESWSTDDFVKT
jgi:hypothetical protein